MLWANHVWWGDIDAVTACVLAFVGVAVPASVSVAVVRHGLLDIRVVLGRTLTYVILVAAVSLLHAGLLIATQHLVGSSTPGGWLAVALVAAGIQPTYAWLRQRVERRVHGFRSQPHRAMRLLADRIEAVEGERAVDRTSSVTAVVTEVVSEVLRADSAWIDDGDDSPPGVVRTPMIHRGERVADLVVQLAPDALLTARDRSLLGDLARYAAVVVHAEGQSRELVESRAQIVAGREEERRRLRNDLHDGVGPSLAAVVLQLDGAMRTVDTRRREELMAEARDGVREAVKELRRAVDDLRPPALDEVGLVNAVRQRAAALALDVDIEVIGPDPVSPLPAAVEVAAFRIASEAMLNAVRHARATTCWVEIEIAGQCTVTVTDDGPGPAFGGLTSTGLGLTSMHERAAELGGTCTVTARPGHGVRVRAELPLGDVTTQPLTGASA